MSRYLIDRIAATPNIELWPHTDIVGMYGDPATGLEGVSWRCRQTDQTEQVAVRNVFLFVGAEPATDWLAGCGVAIDKAGFVRTGGACEAGYPINPLETSVPGVFAVGDVRSGSVKRVGGAIGEGANVVAMIHEYLAKK